MYDNSIEPTDAPNQPPPTMKNATKTNAKNDNAAHQKMVDMFLSAPGGVPVDPQLPADFDACDHADRPKCYLAIWGRPFVVTNAAGAFDVRVLDNGAHDRSRWLATFDNVAAAVEFARWFEASKR
jgi:hypothetical protein